VTRRRPSEEAARVPFSSASVAAPRLRASRGAWGEGGWGEEEEARRRIRELPKAVRAPPPEIPALARVGVTLGRGPAKNRGRA
jgi:hypothetical protein